MRFNTRLIRFLLQLLLFAFYWFQVSGSFPFVTGLLVFLLLYAIGFFITTRISPPLWGALGVTAVLVGLYEGIRLFQGGLSHFSLPWDFGGILAHSLLSFLILPILLFFWLDAFSRRVSWFFIVESALYAGALAFLLGNPSWNLELVLGRSLFSFLMLGVCASGILLLLLSGGKGELVIQVRSEGLVYILLFILMLIPISRLYRSESVKEGGGLLESSLFHFDFADYLTLESRISMKDELVLLMRKDGPTEKIYLRRFVLSGYSRDRGFFKDPEQTWESPEMMLPEYRIPEKPVKWDIPDFSGRERLEQTLYYINFDASSFLGMNLPGEVIPYHTWEGSSFSRIYSVRSSVSQTPAWEFFFLPDPEEDNFMAYYTAYEEQDDLRDLAAAITEGVSGNYQKAMAIEEYFKSEYFYSLNPGVAREGDQLRYFLYDSKKGYCSYFAFSMTLLCRSLGIPARVALGFWVDTESQVLNFYPVNANQAHAWVEVYFPDKGWIEFDPTSQTLAPGEDFEFSSYNPGELEPYIQEILANQNLLEVSDIEFEESSDPSGRGLFREQWAKLTSQPGQFLLWICVIFLGIQSLRVLAALCRFPRGYKRIIPYYRFHRTLLIRGFIRDGAECSPSELALIGAERGAVLFQQFTEEYLALRFSPHPGGCSFWFDRARAVRRELYSLIGIRKGLILFLKTLGQPGRRL